MPSFLISQLVLNMMSKLFVFIGSLLMLLTSYKEK